MTNQPFQELESRNYKITWGTKSEGSRFPVTQEGPYRKIGDYREIQETEYSAEKGNDSLSLFLALRLCLVKKTDQI